MTESTTPGPEPPKDLAATAALEPKPPAPAAEAPLATGDAALEATPITQIKPLSAQNGKPRPGKVVAIILPLLIILASLFFVYHRQTRNREGQPEAPSETQAKPQDDAVRLEGELNRALREAGFGSVTTAVGDDGEVTLTGTVSSERDKKKAFALVESFKGVGTVKDMVFVVES